jgi:hypothetical protein
MQRRHPVTPGIFAFQKPVHVAVDVVYLLLQRRRGVLSLAQVGEEVATPPGFLEARRRPYLAGQRLVERLERIIVLNQSLDE